MELNYVTTNKYKFELASQLISDFSDGQITLKQCDLETPEIQSESPEEISAHSALWAAQKIGAPVVAMDVSFSIDSLNGFPGPFVKYINGWLVPDDILSMMSDKENRRACFIDALSFADPGGSHRTFIAKTSGSIIDTDTVPDTAWTIDALFIPNNHEKTLQEMDDHERSSVWATKEAWKQLVSFVLSRESDS